jgi:hypothetical protein
MGRRARRVIAPPDLRRTPQVGDASRPGAKNQGAGRLVFPQHRRIAHNDDPLRTTVARHVDEYLENGYGGGPSGEERGFSPKPAAAHERYV